MDRTNVSGFAEIRVRVMQSYLHIQYSMFTQQEPDLSVIIPTLARAHLHVALRQIVLMVIGQVQVFEFPAVFVEIKPGILTRNLIFS